MQVLTLFALIPVTKNGAGYTAKIINILEGEKDKWFRPADICVAPDGSLIVADWYDPGVGGHQAGDQTRGRIYRVAPPGSNYTIPEENYSTPEEAIAALQNPNLQFAIMPFTRFNKWVRMLCLYWKSYGMMRMQIPACVQGHSGVGKDEECECAAIYSAG
jgi:hypothetical protein